MENNTNEFLAEYGKLREKYQRDFISVPSFIPNEDGSWKLIVQPQLVNLKEMGKEGKKKSFIS